MPRGDTSTCSRCICTSVQDQIHRERDITRDWCKYESVPKTKDKNLARKDKYIFCETVRGKYDRKKSFPQDATNEDFNIFLLSLGRKYFVYFLLWTWSAEGPRVPSTGQGSHSPYCGLPCVQMHTCIDQPQRGKICRALVRRSQGPVRGVSCRGMPWGWWSEPKGWWTHAESHYPRNSVIY